jgi:hypothetical protein
MKNIFKNIFASLDNHNLGYSGRKLTALFAILMGACVTYTLPLEVRLHALYSWQMLALLCLGIITVEQIIKLKNSNDKPE